MKFAAYAVWPPMLCLHVRRYAQAVKSMWPIKCIVSFSDFSRQMGCSHLARRRPLGWFGQSLAGHD
jgi:hypothetical protein